MPRRESKPKLAPGTAPAAAPLPPGEPGDVGLLGGRCRYCKSRIIAAISADDGGSILLDWAVLKGTLPAKVEFHMHSCSGYDQAKALEGK